LKPEIRIALETEIDTLLQFEAGIIAAERPFDSTLKEGEIHYYDLIQLIRNEKSDVFVAVIDGEIVGSGYVKILNGKAFQKHSEYAFLGFMYVKPEYRGQGINQKIIEKLTQWAKQHDLTEVRLEVYHDNNTAINAYKKVGFNPNIVEMRLEI
jgi:ribosomal protein S18 acetylase RimI-like enzyme